MKLTKKWTDLQIFIFIVFISFSKKKGIFINSEHHLWVKTKWKIGIQLIKLREVAIEVASEGDYGPLCSHFKGQSKSNQYPIRLKEL